MKPESEVSTGEAILAGLEWVWSPGMEAIKLRLESKAQSIEDISIAARRAGYEVRFVDLPETVGGFAVESTPYIVVNRVKPRQHQTFTIAHELGHQVMHLNPTRELQAILSQTTGLEEFQANMFAATLVFGATNDADREEIFRQNPESILVPFLATVLTILTLVVALVFYICSRWRSAHTDKLAGRE